MPQVLVVQVAPVEVLRELAVEPVVVEQLRVVEQAPLLVEA